MNGPELRHQILDNGLRVLRRPADQQETPYVPICLSALMSGERVTFSLYVKITEGPEGNTGFIPYLEEGEILESYWLEKLKKLGIEQLFFHSQDTEKAIAYLNNHLLVESAEMEPSFKELCILREHLSFSLQLAFKDAHLGQHTGLAKTSLTTLFKAMERTEIFWKLLLDVMYRE